MKKSVLTILLLLFICLSNRVFSKDRYNPLELGKEYTSRFFSMNFDYLFEHFSDEMKAAFSKEAIKGFHSQVSAQLGNIRISLSEKVDSVCSPYDIYDRQVIFENIDTKTLIRWAMDTDGVIHSFLIRPIPAEANSGFLDYKSKTDLILPFEGEWLVFWGGRTTLENYHAAYPDQRFAYDFLQLKNRRSFKNSGSDNKDYHCFGRKVIAPGPGVVIEMNNGAEDNEPGILKPEEGMGNFVIIDHLNGEYSFLAHFKKESITVSVGDTVGQGQELGLCGNSGHSSEPHIHYHLQDSPVFNDGNGLPPFFRNYRIDGRLKSGEPVRGDSVRNSR